MESDSRDDALSRTLSRLFKNSPQKKKGNITEDKIRLLVDEGEEKGFIEENQKEMINNVLEFDDLTAGELMVHRTKITAASVGSSIGEVVELAVKEGFSRIPLYEDDIDSIVGMIYIKDLIGYIGKTFEQDDNLKKYIRGIPYVPESKRCKDLFELFSKGKTHMAVVVDEYGGTAGIVTIEDVVEAIVGNIQDEYDMEEDRVRKVSENIFILDGSADLDEVSECLGIEIPESDDYDTVGGFITDLLGKIPGEKERPRVIYKNVEFIVLHMKDRRVAKVKAVIQ
ncbi:MAG: hemolysin family protein [Oscillospiraceae bacterium]|nr:hemolysin family protein [Oscillospiraceae bacterium]